MPELNTKIVACSAAIGAGVGAAILYKHLAATPPPFPSAAPSLGLAAVHRLTEVDRFDLPWGSKGGPPPGRPAAHYLGVGPCESTVDFAQIIQTGGIMLYSVEPQADGGWDSPMLVFLELDAAGFEKLYLEEAFIDRGVRKLVQLGSRVIFASMATAEAHIAASPSVASLGEGGCELGIVWNTGRCGSTLLGKAVMAVGAACVSEPHWCDQLVCKPPDALPAAVVQRCFKLCMAIECALARRALPRWRDTHCIVLNPKFGGAHVTAAVAAVFPKARHIFMYRACAKVVESFGGLLHSEKNMLSILAAKLASFLPGPPPGPPLSDYPLLLGMSSPKVGFQTFMWIDSVLSWLQLCEGRAALGPADPIVAAPTLRYDDFVTKDQVKRQTVLRASLEALGVLVGKQQQQLATDLEAAAAVFNVHSQAGSSMSGPKGKFLAETDLPILHRCVQQTFEEKAGVVVEDGGANIILPKSLGVA